MLTSNKDKCLSPSPDFIYDEACLDIFTDRNVLIRAQYLECQNCSFQVWKSSKSYLVNTKYQLKFQAVFDNITCNRTLKFDEHARYGWNITKDNCSNIYVEEAADNAYLPILGAIIVFLCFGTLWYMIKCIYKCTYNRGQNWLNYFRTSELTNDLGSPLDNAPLVVEQIPRRKHPTRIKSIDVFRGLCIILMIFVNYGGGQYWFFKHSVWNGLTVADLVFPWFMWVMGFSITISLRSRLRTAVPRRQIVVQIIYRACVLILLGIVLNSHGRRSELEDLRFPGVLQRLGVAYLCVGLLEALFTKRSASEDFGRFCCIEDILVAWPQWLVVICLVALHTCFTFLLPVPGCPSGYLGPGGLHDGGIYENCTGGAAGYMDRMVFGTHMYKSASCHIMYETTVRYDPEGLLGTLTTILTVYLGVQAGRILQTYTTLHGKTVRWTVWAIITGLLAGVLCNFSKNDGIIPVNKNLWSLSFALALSSMAFIMECVLYVLVDITRKWGGRPFFYPGMNAILLYIGHDVMRNTFPFAWVPYYKNHREYLAMNLWATFLWVAISIFLYKRNIFFKI